MEISKDQILHLLRQRDTIAWNSWRESSSSSEVDLSGLNLKGLSLATVEVCGENPEDLGVVFHANLSKADLRRADFGEAQFPYADMRFSDLRDSNGEKAQLLKADLRAADLSKANLRQASLHKVNLNGSKLVGTGLSEADLSEANLAGCDLEGAFLFRSDLTETAFTNANLYQVNFAGAWLTRANFQGANLCEADLTAVQAEGANFTGANLTGACIERWNPDSQTKLNNVICDYIYLKNDQQERRPSSGNFAPGGFAILVQKALNTVDLIFADGIDWKAFSQSFQKLQSQYADDSLSIQAIEKKTGGAFVIRLEVLPESNKAAIESQAKELYERDRQMLEAQYREKLNAKDDQIAIYKRQSSSMEEIAKLLATRPIQLEEAKVTLHPDKLKVLQAVHSGLEYSSRISEVTDLSIDAVKYCIECLQNEDYLDYAKYSDGLSGQSNYKCQLTSKGRVALENPDLLQHQDRNVPTHQTTINAPNSQFGFVSSGSGSVSDFTQNIGQNLNDINKLIGSLREATQTFPSAEREEALGHLDDLQEDLSKPERQEPNRIKRRLKPLVAIALTLGAMTATTAGFANDLTDLAEKLGYPIELNQSQTRQIPSAD
jgi:uncharacterized protein YjbI with pentapeptide repeats